MEASFFQLIVAEQRKADPTLSREHALARVYLEEHLQKRMRLMMRYLASAERSAEKARCELERVIAIRLEDEAMQVEMERMRRRADARRGCDDANRTKPIQPQQVDMTPDPKPVSASALP
jgi:hypothetical protein